METRFNCKMGRETTKTVWVEQYSGQGSYRKSEEKNRARYRWGRKGTSVADPADGVLILSSNSVLDQNI